jgi:hypothetical protein
MGWATFWVIFAQAPPVTLSISNLVNQLLRFFDARVRVVPLVRRNPCQHEEYERYEHVTLKKNCKFFYWFGPERQLAQSSVTRFVEFLAEIYFWQIN